MPTNIGPRIGIEGEAEYRKSIQNIIQQQKTLKSEMQATASAWDKNTSAEKKASQQKDALSKQIQVQKQRVEELNKMLKESTEKYGENDTRTLKWKDAVNQATAELNRMQGELKELPDKVDLLGKKFEESGEKIKSAGDKIEGAGRSLAPLSAAAAGGLTFAVKTAADFEQQMSKVQAISGANAEQMDALNASAREWGAKTKFSATEAGEAFEYMAMAGWKDEQMLAGIGPVLNLATAAGEELGTTSDIVTDALTAFGLTAEDTGHFADILAAASSNANTNVTMMGESFKYAAPVAGTLGYSVEDIAIALGLMANNGIKASQAGTSLRNIFQRMAKPTKESETAMNRLGLSMYDDEGRMYSFMEIMEQLRDSMGNIKMPTDDFLDSVEELEKQLADGTITESKYNEQCDELIKQTFGAEEAEKARAAAMLGGARAMAGLLAITSASEEDFAKLSNAVTNSSQEMAMLKDGSVIPLSEALASGQEVIGTYNGAAETMAAVMKDNLNGQVTELKSAVEELGISLGNTLMPFIKDLVTNIQGLVANFNALDPQTKQMIAQVGVIVAALSPALIIIGKLVGAIGTIVTTVGKLLPVIKGAAVAFTGLNPPILIAIAVIGSLIAVGVALYKNWDTVKAKAKAFADSVSTKWKALVDAIKTNVKASMDDLKNAKDRIVLGWQALKDRVVNLMTTLKTNLSNAWTNLKTTITNAVDNIKTRVSTAWDNIKTKISNAMDNIKTKVSTAWENIKTKIFTVMENTKTKISNTWDNIKTSISNKIENIKTTVSNKFQAIKDKITKTIEDARDSVKNAIDRIKGFFDFEWSLPKLKVPHFSISGELSLNPPSVPHIDIDWYSKAMNGGMILKQPTIFGAANGHLLGAGEAGPEVVVGANSLFDMIRGAVASTTNNYGGNNVYVYGAPGQDVKELAMEIADIINADISSEEAAFA